MRANYLGLRGQKSRDSGKDKDKQVSTTEICPRRRLA